MMAAGLSHVNVAALEGRSGVRLEVTDDGVRIAVDLTPTEARKLATWLEALA